MRKVRIIMKERKEMNRKGNRMCKTGIVMRERRKRENVKESRSRIKARGKN